MKKHLQYLRYIARHKWFVFCECCKLGIPLTGIAHDWTKLRPSEFFPYAENFYGWGKDNPSKPKLVLDAFNYAWLQHISRTRHHWEWYILGYKDGKVLVFEMPLRRRKEMLADWRSVSLALKGKDETPAWYSEHKDKMILGDETRKWIEKELGIGT